MGKAWGTIALLLAPLCAAALAGCVECESGPPVTARGIHDGPATAGSGSFTMDILVTDGPGGAPLPRAGVVVYWSSVSTSEWNGPLVEVEGGPQGGRVVVDPKMDQRSVEPDSSIRLLTGADGKAHARVPTNRIVGIVAAKDGYTEEWIPALATGDGGAAGYALPLYRQTVSVEAERVWGPGAASPGAATNGNYAWDPAAIAFGSSDEANRGYAARIVEMTITVRWENAPTHYGDLAIGLGPQAGEGPTFFTNNGNNVAPGGHTETITILVDDLVAHGLLGAPAIYGGAATETAFVAPFGMPYTLQVEARFDRAIAERAAKCGSATENDDEMDVPGSGALAALAALVVAAAVMSRARRP